MSEADIQEFIDRYTGICSRKKLVPIQSVLAQLSGNKAGEVLDLKGNQSELKYHRVDDKSIDALSFCFASTNFLRVLDLSYNEIGDQGVIALSNFIKVKTGLEIERPTFRSTGIEIKHFRGFWMFLTL